MSEKSYRTISKVNDSDADVFIVSSRADFDLGAFLMFSGLAGGVPLYYLFACLVLRIGQPDLTPGFVLSALFILAGFIMVKFSRKKVSVRFDDSTPGTVGIIEIKDGIFGRPVSYKFGDEVQIRLSLSEVTSGKREADRWDVTLINGRSQYLLDSRLDSLQESRAMAEFLVKSMRCRLLAVLDAARTFEIDWKDVDLPYAQRAAKYPELMPVHPERPEECSIEISDIEYGAGRRYSWGITLAGMSTDLMVLFMLAVLGSVVPMWGSGSRQFSLLSMALKSGDWSFFYMLAGVAVFFIIIQMGYRSVVEIRGEKLSVSKKIWGVSFKNDVIFLENLEAIIAHKHSNSSVMFVSDAIVSSLRVANDAVADYMAADVQYFLAATRNGGAAFKGVPAAPQV